MQTRVIQIMSYADYDLLQCALHCSWLIGHCACPKQKPCIRFMILQKSIVQQNVSAAPIIGDKVSEKSFVGRNLTALSNASSKGFEILKIYDEIRQNDTKAELSILIAALKACSTLRDLQSGMRIHADLIDTEYDKNILLANTLVHMYFKCGSRLRALQIFDRMPHQNLVSWNTVIYGYVEHGKGKEVLQLFECMRDQGFAPDARTYVAALKACASSATQEKGQSVDGKLVKIECLEKGIHIHSALAKSESASDIFVAGAMVDMYAKCGSMTHARHVFDRMRHHDVVSWSALIFGYIERGEDELALQLFASMQDEGFTPNAQTYVAALKACAVGAVKGDNNKYSQKKLVKIMNLEKVISIHSQLAKSKYELNVFVSSTLVDVYAKCGSIVQAHQVFENMPCHDMVSWNVMIFGYAESNQGETALHLFVLMQDKGIKPNGRCYVAALKACVSCAAKVESEKGEGRLWRLGYLEKVIAIHSQLAKNRLELDSFVANTLVSTYAKCGSMIHAFDIFCKMPHRTLVAWNTLIFGFTETGEGELALQLFMHMQDEGYTPDSLTYIATMKACASCTSKEMATKMDIYWGKVMPLENGLAIHSQLEKRGYGLIIYVGSTLVDMYAKCGSMIHARRLFDRMLYHDVVSWNALIFGYVESGEGELAMQLFACMQEEGFEPDALTYVAVLKACGSLAALDTGKKVHDQICVAGLQTNMVLSNCLIIFYGKCGCMFDAERIFNSISRRDLVAWNALIAGYALQGDSKQVFGVFVKMQIELFEADNSTFLSVFTACSRTGLLDKMKEYFWAMCLYFTIPPAIEHYACIIDTLGRTNHLDDAMVVIKSMPFESNLPIWRIILGACQKWENVVVGKLALESTLGLDDKDASSHVLMANIFAGLDI